MERKIYLQGKFSKSPCLGLLIFQITNIAILDKRINALKKLHSYKNFHRKQKFICVASKNSFHSYRLYDMDGYVGKLTKDMYRRGWWKLNE